MVLSQDAATWLNRGWLPVVGYTLGVKADASVGEGTDYCPDFLSRFFALRCRMRS